LFPTTHQELLYQDLIKRVKEEPKKSLKNLLKGFVPERFLLFMLDQLELDGTQPANTFSHDRIRDVASFCKSFSFQANGTLSIEKAFVTGGGVSVKEVEPKTMQSKKKAGLFFCGEVLDIHGYTGGYNITCAFSTGYTAGKSAGELVSQK
ncbi:hypothetical protein AB685_28610, partial [Bacillus sp. LL01]|uniref:NAD(P)/FAD-dependent oxidoreductase n=1 Tax=Bacillus sp. LL01 TaxID=1665556 RepID=UPI00064D6C54